MTSFWLERVEHLFALGADDKNRRGIYCCVKALRAGIMDFISHRNADLKPFKRTKFVDDILAFD